MSIDQKTLEPAVILSRHREADCRPKKLTSDEISEFCLEISYLLKSGIPLHDGLSAGIKDRKNSRVNEIMAQVAQNVTMHFTLTDSIRATSAFPEYVCNMCDIGEMSGRLDDVMLALSNHYDREKRLKSLFKSAVTYPVALFFIMSMVVSLLVFKVLPMFERVFSQLGGAVSGQGKAMLRLGTMTGTAALALILVILAFMLFASLSGKTEKGRLFIEKSLMKMSFTRSIISKISAQRFSSAMALALSGGLGLSEAMTMAASITGNSTVRDKINIAIADLSEGMSLGEALEKADIFPYMLTRMAGIGTMTGRLDEVMDKMSEMCSEEIDDSIGAFFSLLEPVLIGIIALIVGMIIISVLMPLAGTMSAIG